MSCCVDGFLQNWAVCAVWAVMCAGSLSLAAEVNSRVFWSSNNMLEVEPSSLVFGATQQALKVYLLTATKTNQEEEHCSESDWDLQTGFESLVYTWKKISTSVTQLYRSKWMSRWQAEQTCFLELPNIGCGECTCSQRRRRFKKRNIAEKVNGTCKQDFTCRNGLIAVPTVNKDFSCCETTQQKCFLLLDVSGAFVETAKQTIVNTYVWRIAATKPWVHRTDNLNIGPCMDISATL
ncbi:hypothetical protein DPMN_092523 [Dreissena polymorpha]|uniref:Uncharacterized protein n=1 Tax=Dreissena polymorpha TaxID=45954 RepID=A0A9D4L1H9_DREPO|nr:hypothetical protein DPMN_092523 [Dreissena polymorpha]